MQVKSLMQLSWGFKNDKKSSAWPKLVQVAELTSISYGQCHRALYMHGWNGLRLSA